MLTFAGAMIGVVTGLACWWFSPAPGIRRDALITAGLAASGSLAFVWISYFYDWCCGIRQDWHAVVAAAMGASIAMIIRHAELHRWF